MDFARSSHPGVQAQLDRLSRLSPGGDVLGLDRIGRLLARLGDPHRRLPPTFHVAGTNGKGSTCAFLRACLEAGGKRVHVFTSPHLVRFNERIRLGGELIGDELLAVTLAEVLDVADGIGPSFFEITTAAAFLLFARTPAEACVVEVGLGGRLDATNMLERPVATGIAALGLDHQQFLGSRLVDIAGEKAGIAKVGVPLVTLAYPPASMRRVGEAAEAAGARWLPRGTAWDARVRGGRLRYRDGRGELDLPLPALTGAHQATNAALAVAMLRHQDAIALDAGALTAGIRNARWPARLQRLGPGALSDLLPPDAELWLDGGHNPAAAKALADFLPRQGGGRPAELVLGMLANKDAGRFLRPLAPMLDGTVAVPIPGHDHHGPGELARLALAAGISGVGTAGDLPTALRLLRGRSDPRGSPPLVLIAGSLYLAGVALELNGELPD